MDLMEYSKSNNNQENRPKEILVGSLYVDKSDKFQTGLSVDRSVSKTLMTHGECAIVFRRDDV